MQYPEDVAFAAALAIKVAEPTSTKSESWEFETPIQLDAVVNLVRHLHPIKPGMPLIRMAVEVMNAPDSSNLLKMLNLTDRVFEDFLVGDTILSSFRIGVAQTWKFNGYPDGQNWTVNTTHLRSLEKSYVTSKGKWQLIYTAVAENPDSQSVIAVAVLERIMGSGLPLSGRKGSEMIDLLLQRASDRMTGEESETGKEAIPQS